LPPRSDGTPVKVCIAPDDNDALKLRMYVDQVEARSFAWPLRIVEVAGKPVAPVINLAQRVRKGGSRVTALVEHLCLWSLKLDGVPHKTVRCLLCYEEISLMF
jgi:hypothetical protein